MKLSEYKIDNFKSIRHGKFDASDTTVIIGRNNSGKSNITESLEIFKDKVWSSLSGNNSKLDSNWFRRCVTGKDDGKDIVWELVFSPSAEDFEEIKSEVNLSRVAQQTTVEDALHDDDLSSFKLKITAQSGSQDTMEYMAYFDGEYTGISNLRSERYVDGRNIIISIGQPIIREKIDNSVSSWNFVSPIREPEDDMPSSPSYELDGRGTQLVQVLHYLSVNEEDRFAKIRRSFLDIMEGISDMGVRFDEDSEEDAITVMVDEGHFDTRFRSSEISSGSKEILVLLTQAYLSQDDTKLLVLEEPELHLHPGAERKVFNILREISEEANTQIILSTHSDVFVNQVEVEDIVRTERNGETTIRHIEEGELEEELADLGYNQSRILQAEGVVFVEGRSDKRILIEFCKLKGIDLSDMGIEIVELEGEGNTMGDSRSLVKVLYSFDIPYLFVVDSHGNDPHDVMDEYHDAVNRDGAWWHTEPRHFAVWSEYGIESYLMFTEAIASAIGDTDPETISDFIQEAENDSDVDESDKANVLECVYQRELSSVRESESAYSKDRDGMMIARNISEEDLNDEVIEVVEKIQSLSTLRPKASE